MGFEPRRAFNSATASKTIMGMRSQKVGLEKMLPKLWEMAAKLAIVDLLRMLRLRRYLYSAYLISFGA